MGQRSSRLTDKGTKEVHGKLALVLSDTRSSCILVVENRWDGEVKALLLVSDQMR